MQRQAVDSAGTARAGGTANTRRGRRGGTDVSTLQRARAEVWHVLAEETRQFKADVREMVGEVGALPPLFLALLLLLAALHAASPETHLRVRQSMRAACHFLVHLRLSVSLWADGVYLLLPLYRLLARRRLAWL